MTEHISTEQELRLLCQEWQKRLRLQDWDVSVGITRGRDMPLESKRACVEWNVNNKTAHISILDPIDYPPELEPQDMEQGVIHELLHLHFTLLDALDKEDAAKSIALEQAIVCIAAALVNFKREAVL